MQNWAVLSDEQMSTGWPFSLLNDEQMSNKVGVEHQPENYSNYCYLQQQITQLPCSQSQLLQGVNAVGES